MTRARRHVWRISVTLQRRGWNAFFGAIARIADGTLARRARRAHIEIIRDVAYGPHPVAHRLDVYRPLHADGPLPVLLYIHGGAFTVCSKETHRGIALAKAAGSRYVAFNINYRLAPRHKFPAAIEDACAAYRWVVANAHKYGGDPRRIVVAGESAGGNLALGVTVAATYRRPEPYAQAVYALGVKPCAVMPITPYLQASNPGDRADAGFFSRRVAEDIARLYLGDGTHDPKKTLMADPIRVLEECGRPRRHFPQVLSGVGTRDLCHSDVQRLERACRRLGIRARVRYYKGEVHAFHALRWRVAARLFWVEMFRFMRAVAVARPLRKTARVARAATRKVQRVAQRSTRRLRARAALGRRATKGLVRRARLPAPA